MNHEESARRVNAVDGPCRNRGARQTARDEQPQIALFAKMRARQQIPLLGVITEWLLEPVRKIGPGPNEWSSAVNNSEALRHLSQGISRDDGGVGGQAKQPSPFEIMRRDEIAHMALRRAMARAFKHISDHCLAIPIKFTDRVGSRLQSHQQKQVSATPPRA